MPKGVANKRYTPEFKKLVIETMQEEKENDYLKNLQALVLEDERRQRKKRW